MPTSVCPRRTPPSQAHDRLDLHKFHDMFALHKFLDTRGRNPLGFQFLPCQASRCTVMVSSHIWWVDLIACARHRVGCSVLVTPPLYRLYTEEAAWPSFEP